MSTIDNRSIIDAIIAANGDQPESTADLGERAMIIGIVGSEAAKFTSHTEAKAREIIRALIQTKKYAGGTSGACHLGGVDIFAREEFTAANLPFKEFPAIVKTWDGTKQYPGYKQRNISIATLADHVVCITLKELPSNYQGMRFNSCYHCKTNTHIKSGGCWTVRYAKNIGKTGEVIVIDA